MEPLFTDVISHLKKTVNELNVRKKTNVTSSNTYVLYSRQNEDSEQYVYKAILNDIMYSGKYYKDKSFNHIPIVSAFGFLYIYIMKINS